MAAGWNLNVKILRCTDWDTIQQQPEPLTGPPGTDGPYCTGTCEVPTGLLQFILQRWAGEDMGLCHIPDCEWNDWRPEKKKLFLKFMKAPSEFCAKGFKVIVSCRELGDIGVGRCSWGSCFKEGGIFDCPVHWDLLHHMGSSVLCGPPIEQAPAMSSPLLAPWVVGQCRVIG